MGFNSYQSSSRGPELERSCTLFFFFLYFGYILMLDTYALAVILDS